MHVRTHAHTHARMYTHIYGMLDNFFTHAIKMYLDNSAQCRNSKWQINSWISYKEDNGWALVGHLDAVLNEIMDAPQWTDYIQASGIKKQ